MRGRQTRRRHHRLALMTAGLLTSLVPQFGIASATADPFPITRVSRDVNGNNPDGRSEFASISTSRYVAFESEASDLVPDDGNGAEDVFVRDMLAGTTTRASVDTAGGDADGASWQASISADGRYVAFQSSATDLVADDGNGTVDIFVRDLVADITRRASVDMEGGDPDDASVLPSISANGGSVAFESYASDLVSGDENGEADVYVRDLVADTTVRASVDITGGDTDGRSQNASISGSGRYVAFETFASLVPEGVGGVVVRDVVAGRTRLVSVNSAGDPANHVSRFPSISANGRHVSFESFATNLAPGDVNDQPDVFVRDVVAGITSLVSVDTAGGNANSWSEWTSISADGRYVAFESSASDLVADDGNGRTVDIFVRDMVAGLTTRVSTDTSGDDADGLSRYPAISWGGTFVVFESDASDLVPGDNNELGDIFRRRLR